MIAIFKSLALILGVFGFVIVALCIVIAIISTEYTKAKINEKQRS